MVHHYNGTQYCNTETVLLIFHSSRPTTHLRCGQEVRGPYGYEQLQNYIILLIFKIWKFGNIRFVGNLIGDIHWNFYDDDVTNCDVISTQNPVSQCSILPSSFLLQLASVKQHASCEKVNKFYKQTCLNIKHKRFTFQRIVQIHLIIYRITRRSDRMRESTAANVASVIEKIRRPGCPSPTNFYDYRQTFYTKHVLLVL